MLRMRQLLWHSLPFNKSMQANIIMRVPPARIHPLGLTGKDTPSLMLPNSSTNRTVGIIMTNQQACTMTPTLATTGTPRSSSTSISTTRK
nr:unnamed protein product [Callosobruchus chinensis]